ncbi:MAG: hypothetical protein ACE5ID_01385 [Acidobacteriota bacterium]
MVVMALLFLLPSPRPPAVGPERSSESDSQAAGAPGQAPHLKPRAQDRTGQRSRNTRLETSSAGTGPEEGDGRDLEDPSAAEREPRRQADLRRQAEEALHRADSLKTRLTSQQVQIWDGASFSRATRILPQGNKQMTAGHFGEALGSYEQAIAIMQSIESRAAEVLRQTLEKGEKALAAIDQEGAVAAFDLATRIDPDNRAAMVGLSRARVLDRVARLLAAGRQLEEQGDLDRAIHSYKQAVSLDPHSTAARDRVRRLQEQMKTNAWNHFMSQGLARLSAGDPKAARKAFIQAGRLRPDDPRVRDGLARVAAAQEDREIARLQAEAAALEEKEDWKQAAARYRQILKVHPTVKFAQEGEQRSLKRADLADRLAFHLAHPDRFSTPAVLEEVKKLLIEAGAVVPQGPQVRRKTEELRQLAAAAEHPVKVALISDDATQVTIYHVGTLGTFTRREIQLRPGIYTVVGTRQGFRDVRRQLRVEPGKTPPPLLVRCEEKI